MTPASTVADIKAEIARACAVQVVVALEDRFRIQIPDGDVPRLRTPNEVARLVEQLALTRRPTG